MEPKAQKKQEEILMSWQKINTYEDRVYAMLKRDGWAE
jgi:hypothetical protein